jgi:V/A-type H+-transporting ATPase subunit E
MKGLDKITGKIIEEAQIEANQLLKDADEKCVKIAQDYAARAKSIRQEIDENAQKQAEYIISHAKSTAAMAKRNILLDAKAQLVDIAFKAAFEEFTSMTDEKYQSFLIMLLTYALGTHVETQQASIALDGEENVLFADKYEIILNKKDSEKHGQAVLDGVRRNLVGKISSSVFEKLYISKSTANIEGGLILRYGDVEMNCSLEMLFAQKKDRLEVDVYKILFG